jgi:hypothetical protein
MCTFAKKCLLSLPVEASAAPRPENSDSNEKLFNMYYFHSFYGNNCKRILNMLISTMAAVFFLLLQLQPSLRSCV